MFITVIERIALFAVKSLFNLILILSFYIIYNHCWCPLCCYDDNVSAVVSSGFLQASVSLGNLQRISTLYSICRYGLFSFCCQSLLIIQLLLLLFPLSLNIFILLFTLFTMQSIVLTFIVVFTRFQLFMLSGLNSQNITIKTTKRRTMDCM